VQSPDGPLYATVTRVIDPPSAKLSWRFLGSAFSFGGTLAEMHGAGDMHNRFMKIYMGYQYRLDQVSDGNYRVSFSPLDAATIRMGMGPFRLIGQVLQLPSLPDPSLARLDEPFEITLYSSGGERIYD